MGDYDPSKVQDFNYTYFQQPIGAGWISAPTQRRKPLPDDHESAPRRKPLPDEPHPDHEGDEEYTAEHHLKRHHEPPQTSEAESGSVVFAKLIHEVRKRYAEIDQALYEPPPEMIYNANIADASYAFYNKNEERLAEIEEATGLKIDRSLSDEWSVVLHDGEGKAYISYRGTDPKNAQDLAEDWRIFTSKTIKKGEGMTPRLASAEAKYLMTAGKYEVAGVAGHSLGGHQSLHIAEKYGVEGFHYNPAVSYEQAFNQLARSSTKQMIYRNPDDPVSMWSAIASLKSKLTGKVPNPNRVVHHTPLTESVKDSHSLSNMTKAKAGKFSATAVEEASTGAKALAVAKRGGEVLMVGFAAYTLGEDIKEGKSAGETAQDVFETIIPVEPIGTSEGEQRRNYQRYWKQKKRDDEAYKQSKGFEERMNARERVRVRVPNDAPKEAKDHPERWVDGTHNGKKGGWLRGIFYVEDP